SEGVLDGQAPLASPEGVTQPTGPCQPVLRGREELFHLRCERLCPAAFVKRKPRLLGTRSPIWCSALAACFAFDAASSSSPSAARQPPWAAGTSRQPCSEITNLAKY